MTDDKAIKILHVTSNPEEYFNLRAQFSNRGGEPEIERAVTGAEAVESVKKTQFDCIVCDHDEEWADGLQFLKTLRESGVSTPVIVRTDRWNDDAAAEALRAGADECIRRSHGVSRDEALLDRIGSLAHTGTARSERAQAAAEERRFGEGIIHWVESRTAELRAANEILMREVAALRRAEAELRDSERRFRSLFENASIGLYRASPEGDILLANDALLGMLGCGSPEEFVVLELRPVDRSEVPAGPGIDIPACAAEEIVNRESEWKKRDGSIVCVRESIKAVRDETGNIAFYEGTVQDITEQKKTQESLRFKFELEELITSLSTQFIILPPERIDEGVHMALANVGEFLDASRGAVFVFSEDRKTMLATHYWHSESIEEVRGERVEYPVEKISWLLERGSEPRAIFLKEINQIPSEAADFRKILAERDVKSIVIVPMLCGDELFGGLTFSSVRPGSRWPDETIPLLKIFADMLANALNRKRFDEEFIKSRDRLQEQTRLLAEANKELEAFSYSVSHDLRAPLMRLWSYAQFLTEDYQEKLGKRGKEYLAGLQNACKAMDRLIDDLLRLSKVSVGEFRVTTVDLSSMVRAVINLLSKTNPGRRAEFAVADNLSVIGDESLLQVALENLLNNAWKFTSVRDTSKIQFGAIEWEGKTAYFVKDNGVGFDMDKADKLFLPFQRLHTGREFEGSGIGLATVKRIINRHGGHIWAEATPGLGATFYFTLK
jgi:PAS domain S-box-containing protein